MDLSPKSLSRGLPWLAAALAVEGGVAVFLVFSDGSMGWSCLQAMLHTPQIALILVFAGAVKVMTAGGAERIPCQRLQWGAFACITATALARYVDVTVDRGSPRGWLFFHAISSVLTAAAVPGLWGCALARKEDLGSERVATFGRLYARAAFAGMFALILAEGFAIAALGVRETLGSITLGAALSTVTLPPARVCLLCAAWDAWRPAPDEMELLRRAQRSGLYLPVSAAASMLASFVTGITWSAESHRLGGYADTTMLVWHGVVQMTLTLLSAILVARALEDPRLLHEETPPPFAPEPERPRNTGPIDVP